MMELLQPLNTDSTYDEVWGFISSTDFWLNSVKGELHKYHSINEFISSFSSSPEKLGVIVTIVNSDQTVRDSTHAGSLQVAAREWYKKKYKREPSKTLFYKLNSRDYLDIISNWEAGKKTTGHLSHGEEDSEIIKKIDSIFEDAFLKNASDIHLEIRQKDALIRYRIDGELRSQRHMRPEEAESIANVLWGKIVEGQGNSYNPKIDGASGAAERAILVNSKPENIRLRMQVLPHRSQAYDIQMRFMPTLDINEEPDLLKLGYRKSDAQALEDSIRNHSGLILLSGQTGSGKTTTLANLILQYMSLNSSPNGGLLKKVITVEDPVEIVIPGITQIQLEGKGKESLDDRMQRYAEPIRWALRGDPDMLVASEIRESAGANTVVSAVQSGHLCLSTLHAGTNFGVFNRLASNAIGVSHDVMSDRDFIRVLCNQTLVQKLCHHCKVPILSAKPSDKDMLQNKVHLPKAIEALSLAGMELSNVAVRSDVGCENCNHTGITGVRVIAETLIPNDDILSLVKDKKINEARNFWAKDMRGVSLVDHALILIERGEIDPLRIFASLGGLNPTNYSSGME